jgi:aminoglycoside phosphotransferase (APT) family kinase protein
MNNTVLTFLEANRQRLDLERFGATAPLSCVVITPRFRASSHVVFLVLPKGQPDPVLVAKVPRLAGASASIEREVANLRAVQALRAGGFDSIPRVIAFEEYCGRPILVETALVGRSMDPATVRHQRAGCCDAVVGWLADVQQPARAPADVETSWFERLIARPLRFFAESFPLSDEDAQLLERTWALIAPLRDSALPLVVEHGDLSNPNIMLMKNGDLGVVDWELAEPYGLPTNDLFFFLTYAAFAVRNARSNSDYLAAFQSAFFGPAAWARPYILAYAERLQLAEPLLTPLFVVCWARYIAGLLMRLGAATGPHGRFGADTADWLRANRYYALWRYTVTHANDLDWRARPQQ